MTAASELRSLVSKAKAYVADQKRLHPQAKVLTQQPLRPSPKAGGAPSAVLSVGPRPAADPNPQAPWAGTLEEFEAQISGCLRCPLGATRKKFVFGSGDPHAKLVFFGAAPGAEDDATGQPFAGESGKLLTKIIAAMGFKREEVYLMNALKCRVPQGKEAQAAALEACRPYYGQQLSLIGPRAVCALGAEATRELLGADVDFEKARGKFYEQGSWVVMPAYHPEELLRNEGLKRQAWEDMKALLKKIS